MLEIIRKIKDAVLNNIENLNKGCEEDNKRYIKLVNVTKKRRMKKKPVSHLLENSKKLPSVGS